uniref:Heat shock factor-binding protein 1 n=1 Tax=Gasterosteus aculeatus aculeatus TaxID=481459 RepID=A0AAQ4RUB9_GASAC
MRFVCTIRAGVRALLVRSVLPKPERPDLFYSARRVTTMVQTLLQQMQDKFQTMSDQIIGRIDEMSTRIDDLEKNIADLMTQAGVEEIEAAPEKAKEGPGS